MGLVGNNEVRVSMVLSSHVDLLPSAQSESIFTSHTANSMGQMVAPHFQRDQLWVVGEQVDASKYNF